MNKDYSFGKQLEQGDANLSERRFRKSIELKKDVLLPRKGFTTYGELMTFYDGLIRYCLYYELRRESIEGSIARLKDWINKTVPMLKEFSKPARTQLEEIHKLLDFEKGRLDFVKEQIRMIYNTNELIINGFLEAIGTDEKKLLTLENNQNTHHDLLHGGGEGWMLEYEVYLDGCKKGYLTFLTFGTGYESLGWDVIKFKVPLDSKIKIFTSFKKPKN